MDSVQPRIDPVSRYGAVNPTDGVQPVGRATVDNRNASQAAQPTVSPPIATTVTLSRRAQELAARDAQEESRESTPQAEALQARQQAAESSAAPAVSAAQQANSANTRDAQVRRAYQASEDTAATA